ncbi:MAG: hypothetical protein J3K34DRAFT_244030 [Monoraphidium minutum]|nr:MAG: hypothetical protein J3K34DRAFT_244030 [Monoraphidium minutum]
MRCDRVVLCLALLLLLSAPHTDAKSCPVTYELTQPRGGPGMLMGGVLNTAACRSADSGAACERSGYWAEECRMQTSSNEFGVCDDAQRAVGLGVARKIKGGAPLRLSPCDLFPYLRGRTLWLMGDSHTKGLFKALQCFLFDLWDGKQECSPGADDDLVRRLDDLPLMRGESKCIHLAGGGRVCRVQTVLGASVVGGDPRVPEGGVLKLLREKFASPDDIFLLQFGIWDFKAGVDAGAAALRDALKKLGEDYQRTKKTFPHVIYRETPASHDKDAAHDTCRPASKGWILDYDTGALSVDPTKRSQSGASAARGGLINGLARDVLKRYRLPVMGGYSYSLPLHGGHVMRRGTAALDCLHYCSFGLGEILVYELYRQLRVGLAGVKPLPEAAAARAPERVCRPLLGAY